MSTVNAFQESRRRLAGHDQCSASPGQSEFASLFGHIIQDSAEGPVYKEGGDRVDLARPRPCRSCQLQVTRGSHDPCIAGLEGVSSGCCGHGLHRKPAPGRFVAYLGTMTKEGIERPGGKLAGYVQLDDGRYIEFSGTVGGDRVREVVNAALASETLPEGFFWAEEAWWKGLTDSQREYCWQEVSNKMADLVLQATGLALASDFHERTRPWWDGLTKSQQDSVWSMIPRMLQLLKDESRRMA